MGCTPSGKLPTPTLSVLAPPLWVLEQPRADSVALAPYVLGQGGEEGLLLFRIGAKYSW